MIGKKRILFSLVTTCRNEMLSLPRWKQNILDQTRPPDEIVVVDAFSDDGTFEYLQEWALQDSRVKVIQEKGAAAKGRNTAISKASYDYILSTDMGVRLNEIWCEELIVPMEVDSSIEVVAGNTCIDTETIKSKVAKAEFYLENGGFAKLTQGHIPGNRSIAYKKDVWEEVGRLPEDLTFYADDSVFGRQLVQGNYKFGYAPKAMTFWARPNSFKAFFREHYVYGKGDGEAYIKTPRAFKWYQSKRLNKKLVPIVHSFNNLLKGYKFKGMFRALKKGDLLPMVLIPWLVAGRTYWYAKGYIDGYIVGNKSCKNCRARLKRDNKGFALL